MDELGSRNEVVESSGHSDEGKLNCKFLSLGPTVLGTQHQGIVMTGQHTRVVRGVDESLVPYK